ncbi:MAG: hypothetical protein GIW97_05755 [Candidatus Eremiobacteraeota bacterium]|nr:hypothetical protein [Candidatus Eremiobacteraeota bacterium]
MSRAAVGALVALLLFVPVPARADCAGQPGTGVLLFSNRYDPDVLVWDSKQRLLDYQAGGWSVARLLLPHALLARAGTKAVLQSCAPSIVHPKYQLAPADAAGIKLTSGPYKGRYGWVMAVDLRLHR